ncbi:hypothetical protein [Nitrospirillum amazonense]|uniref:hypothetical protein n=1 Tax=Nitrospirillum amazonense TaxID=28077 RepID=UPI0011A30267|nr:hypothetical protein [Nitrospirillum amazonense]
MKKIGDEAYYERRLIAVSNKAVIEAASNQEESALKKKNESLDWTSVANAALKIGGLEYSLAKLIVGVGIEAYKALDKARESGVPIRDISFDDASDLIFPPGHPREGVVYVCHPVLPRAYCTMADFHRIVFEHKFSEAMLLLMSLGAESLEIEHVTGWSNEFSAKISANLPARNISPSLDGKKEDSSERRTLFSASLSGSTEPKLPSGLSWYPHESMWQSIARGRIEFGLSDFSLIVSSTDNYGIDARISASVLKAGLEIGGSFEEHKTTVWRLVGKFNKPNNEK